MIFSGQDYSLITFQKQGKIKTNLKKQQNPCNIAEIMKKTGFLASFILGAVTSGPLSSVFFIFLKSFYYVWCVWKKRNTTFKNLKKKKKSYEYDTTIRNGQVHQWNLKIKIYMIYL